MAEEITQRLGTNTRTDRGVAASKLVDFIEESRPFLGVLGMPQAVCIRHGHTKLGDREKRCCITEK
jgi:hypothetical protein